MVIKCSNCPLRRHKLFKPLPDAQIAYLQKFKKGELQAEAGTEIMSEGASSAHLYTVLSGMGVRSKMVANGRRQVVGFALPGDFIGLQTGVMEEMEHSVEVTTPMRLCTFNRSGLWDLFQSHPELAFDLTHLAAREEYLLGEAMMVLGQYDARSKVAWVMLRFHQRLSALDLNRNGQVPLPYRQQDIADALGLSLVHTIKTLSALRSEGILTWADGRLTVHDEDRLIELSHSVKIDEDLRPLI